MKTLSSWEAIFADYFEGHQFDDGGHDLSHFQRVSALALNFASEEADRLVILAASYFHDIVNYPKNDSRRSRSSVDAAKKACEILEGMNFPKEKLSAVSHCIEAHSYSAGITPEGPEAMAVQDADRMEALGAIGLARTFYIAGVMGSSLFDPVDPFAKSRDLNDMKYAVDHFQTKLLGLHLSMKTPKGKIEAQKRTKVLQNFLDDLKLELKP